MITHPEVSFQMVVRSLALCLALMTLPAIAQNNFSITLHGKPAGKASYTIDKTKDGFHVKSKVSYRLTPTSDDATAVPARGRSSGSAAPGVAKDFQFVGDYKLDADSSFAGGFINNMITLVNTSYSLSKSRDKLFISQNQVGGVSLPTIVDLKPDFIFLPDYDPSFFQSLLLQTAARPAPKGSSTSPSCPAKSREKMPLPQSGSQTSPTPAAFSTEIRFPSATSYSASTSPSTISSPTKPTHSCSLPARTCPPSSPATASSLSQPNNRHYLLSGIFKKSPTPSADRVNRDE